MVDLSADSLIFAMTDEIRDGTFAFRFYRHVSVFRQYDQENLLGGCWEEGLWGGLVDYSTQLMLGGGLVRKEAVK